MTDKLRYALRLQAGAVLVALIAVGAFVSVPVPGSPVPIVVQNLFVVMTGLLLPPAWAAITVATYLLLGAVGLPIFAGGAGGIAHIAGPTGGYLIGFLFAAVITSAIIRPHIVPVGTSRPRIRDVVGITVGFLAVYLVGAPWLMRAASLDVTTTLAVGVLPFLVGDAVKVLVIIILLRTLPARTWRLFASID